MIPFLLWNHLVCGQTYLPYYHLCHDAAKAMYLENYELAQTKFEQAFELVDYVHTTSYEKASQCAIALGDFQQGYQWAQKALLNGSHNHFWKARKFRAFRQSTYGQWLRDSIPYFQRQAVEKVDTVYLKQIDSLYFVDQYIIRGSIAAKGNYAIDKSALPENRFELDSTNLIALIQLIEAYGFPSEQLLGVDGYQKATMIIHHNFRLEHNEKYHPIVLKALFEENIYQVILKGCTNNIACGTKTLPSSPHLIKIFRSRIWKGSISIDVSTASRIYLPFK